MTSPLGAPRAATCTRIAVVAMLALTTPLPTQELAKHYRGKLDHEPGALGRSWTCEPSDVWQLSSFRYRLGDKLAIDCGPATLVLGKHGTAKSGYSPVWAALFPEEPSPLRARGGGDGEAVRSIFLRFHPALPRRAVPRRLGRGTGRRHDDALGPATLPAQDQRPLAGREHAGGAVAPRPGLRL